MNLAVFFTILGSLAAFILWICICLWAAARAQDLLMDYDLP